MISIVSPSENISAKAASQGIDSRTSKDPVVTSPTINNIGTTISKEVVIACTARQVIITIASSDRIIPIIGRYPGVLN